MVEEICRRNHQRAIATRKNANLFGMPKHVEKFNEVLQELSRELNTKYLDIYNPMKNHADKASLFYPTDGVHLSEAGHAFVADAIMQAMPELRQEK